MQDIRIQFQQQLHPLFHLEVFQYAREQMELSELKLSKYLVKIIDLGLSFVKDKRINYKFYNELSYAGVLDVTFPLFDVFKIFTKIKMFMDKYSYLEVTKRTSDKVNNPKKFIGSIGSAVTKTPITLAILLAPRL